MSQYIIDTVCNAAGASACELVDVIQELWSGYGTIRRYALKDSDCTSVVVKHVHCEGLSDHPRGWNTDISHHRKLRSYEIERSWYNHWSLKCDDSCRVPNCLAIEIKGDETVIVLEDLDASGYAERRAEVSHSEIVACLAWLANFHATFIGCNPAGLWPQGTYWHLDTRPDELNALTEVTLKGAAAEIDRRLKECCCQTFVHGDAKLANFCFSVDGRQVAAVDFQYVGGGCGMKDVAYFIGSCLTDGECEQQEAVLLDTYFSQLRRALARKKSSIDIDSLEAEWRSLFPLAWTDFHRFLKGWCPDHWKINSYSEKMAQQVISSL